MKPERIEELLAGTKYADKTCKDHTEVDVDARCITTWTEVAGDKAIMEDRRLNAARVQLLAKALREIYFLGFDEVLEPVAEGGECWTVKQTEASEIAGAALAEAGLQEKVG